MTVTATIDGLSELVREAVREELATQRPAPGWFDVGGAAEYLATTQDAIRSMVKRGELPVHRTPNGRLLFHPDELDEWVDRDRDRLLAS